MKNIDLIQKVIDEKLDVAARMYAKAEYPALYFDDEDDATQGIYRFLVKKHLYNLFLYDNFEQRENVTADDMADALHNGAGFFKNHPELKEASDEYKQHCQAMAKIAFEYVLPAILAETQLLLQASPRPKGIRGWARNAIRTVREVFRDGGG